MIISSREKVLFAVIFTLLIVFVVTITWFITKGGASSKADENTNPTPTTTTTTTSQSTTPSTSTSSGNVKLVLQPGFNLVTIPYILSPSDGKTALLGLATREAFYLNDAGKWSSLYQGGTITPGQGLWIKSDLGESYQLPVQSTAVATDKPFTISLHSGWNAIGNPFPKDITWNPSVKTAKGTTSFKEAVDAKILSVGYISDSVTREYKTVNAGDQIKSFQGLLIRSGGDDISLIVSGV